MLLQNSVENVDFFVFFLFKGTESGLFDLAQGLFVVKSLSKSVQRSTDVLSRSGKRRTERRRELIERLHC